jgi:hypothetical protein
VAQILAEPDDEVAAAQLEAEATRPSALTHPFDSRYFVSEVASQELARGFDVGLVFGGSRHQSEVQASLAITRTADAAAQFAACRCCIIEPYRRSMTVMARHDL